MEPGIQWTYGAYLYDRCELLQLANNVTEKYVVKTPEGVYDVRVISAMSRGNTFQMRCMVERQGGNIPVSIELSKLPFGTYSMEGNSHFIAAKFVCENYMPHELASFFDPLLTEEQLQKYKGMFEETRVAGVLKRPRSVVTNKGVTE